MITVTRITSEPEGDSSLSIFELNGILLLGRVDPQQLCRDGVHYRSDGFWANSKYESGSLSCEAYYCWIRARKLKTEDNGRCLIYTCLFSSDSNPIPTLALKWPFVGTYMHNNIIPDSW